MYRGRRGFWIDRQQPPSTVHVSFGGDELHLRNNTCIYDMYVEEGNVDGSQKYSQRRTTSSLSYIFVGKSKTSGERILF